MISFDCESIMLWLALPYSKSKTIKRVSYHKMQGPSTMDLVGNLAWTSSSHTYQHLAFLRRLEIYDRTFEQRMLDYLCRLERCPVDN